MCAVSTFTSNLNSPKLDFILKLKHVQNPYILKLYSEYMFKIERIVKLVYLKATDPLKTMINTQLLNQETKKCNPS